MPRSYDKEFKEYVAKLVVEDGKKSSEVSRELDVPYKTMSRWVNDYRKKKELEEAKIDYITPSEHKKMEKELLRQITDLEEENAILKKAATIFMKNQD